jgi:hypothetical protein
LAGLFNPAFFFFIDQVTAMLKKIQIIALLVFIPLASYALFGTGDDDKTVGQLKVKSDKVYVLRNDRKIPINNFGMLLQAGDIVQTDVSGKAQIETTAGDKVFIGPSTKLDVQTQIAKEKKGVKKFFLSVWGKLRAQVRKGDSKRVIVRTPSATVGVKGTDFVVEYRDQKTRVGTLQGLVNLASNQSQNSVDIPANKMSGVSATGDVLPVSAFAGELLEGVEFAGEAIEEEEFSGGKLKM